MKNYIIDFYDENKLYKIDLYDYIKWWKETYEDDYELDYIFDDDECIFDYIEKMEIKYIKGKGKGITFFDIDDYDEIYENVYEMERIIKRKLKLKKLAGSVE